MEQVHQIEVTHGLWGSSGESVSVSGAEGNTGILHRTDPFEHPHVTSHVVALNQCTTAHGLFAAACCACAIACWTFKAYVLAEYKNHITMKKESQNKNLVTFFIFYYYIINYFLISV